MIKKVTKDTTLEDILKISGSGKILLKHGVPCLSCPMASLELGELKIGQISKVYGLDLVAILGELNCLPR